MSLLLGNSTGSFAGQIYTIETATHLEFLTLPGTAAVGEPLAAPDGVKVVAKDQFGNTVVDDNSTSVTLTLVGGTFSGGGTTAIATVSGGVATFTNLVIDIPGEYSLQASSSGLAGDTTPDFLVLGNVVARKLFYNQSGTAGPTVRYDGNNPAANSLDDNAIALDKVALLPGAGPASFANVSSYSRGINGVMVDLYAFGSITASDFIFKMGNNNAPSSWAPAPTPTLVTVRSGFGTSGSDRIELIWTNGVHQENLARGHGIGQRQYRPAVSRCLLLRQCPGRFGPGRYADSSHGRRHRRARSSQQC